MKIVVAAWHLRDFNVGLGRYCRELIDAIGRVDRDNQYDVLMPTDACRFPERPNFRYRLIRFPVFRRRFWEQMAPLLVGRYDVLHFPYDSRVAWKRGKFIATVHDVKPLLFGALRPRRSFGGVIERILVGDRWAGLDHVVTDSESSRQDLMRQVGLPAHRVTVVPPGVDPARFRPAGAEEQFDVRRSTLAGLKPRTSNLERRTGPRPYILCVAGSDPTKNVSTLVEAFAKLALPIRETHDLVLVGDVGKRTEVRDQIVVAGLEKQAVFTGVVSDERLIELYQHAAAFVFPSLYEGFGLPVLEAMACGCPVISSNAASLPEVAGDAAILVDPKDTQGFSDAMARVLADADLRRDLREKGLTQAAQFTWDRTAREMVAVYRKVGEG
ncbi:MAG: glycosyltransferase family 1 protein [Nitrospirota bacterium]